MNSWLKQNWFKVVILILLLGAFYWYGIRPANIRIKCKGSVSDSRIDLTSEIEKDELGQNMNKINAAEREKSDFWYKDCLRAKGLVE